MDIQPKHIKNKKRIGTLDGKPVVELTLHGGLVVHAVQKGGKVEFLGSGSHRAIARHISAKNHPEIVFTELSKGDWVDPDILEAVSPRYEALTDRLNELLTTHG